MEESAEDAAVDGGDRFSTLARYSYSPEISSKSTFPSALRTVARIALISERARGLEYMHATFCPLIPHTYSPWVTAGFGDHPEEEKSLLCSAGEECQHECWL